MFADMNKTNPKNGRTIFSTVSGYYVVKSGKNPELYKGTDLDEALRIFKEEVSDANKTPKN